MFTVLIVTYYCTNNYGSFLQAWALGQFFKDRNCEVHYWGSKELEAKNIVNNNNIYRRGKDEKLMRALNEFDIDYDCERKYDLIVVGSDVVWASTKIKAFWGRKLNGEKIISYAASMWGMCDSVGIPLKVRKFIEKTRLYSEQLQLKKFAGISVRDERTYSSIKAIVGKSTQVERVLDPTFLMENAQKINRLIPEPYILVYSYSLVGEDINPVLEYAKKHGTKICLIGYRAVFADYNLAVTPFELLALFKYADAVFSTTFHGTALSLVYRCNFVAFDSSHKSRQLLEEFGLEDRLVNSDTALEAIEKNIDYDRINILIEKKRKKSIEFLEKFIPERLNSDENNML